MIEMSIFFSTDQAFISKLTGIIHDNLENPDFGVDELAHAAGMSRASLHRRIIAKISKQPCQFIREVRLKRAMEMLKQGGVTASEVGYSVGFGSPAYFNTCFHEFYGFPPGKVIKGDIEIQDLSGNDPDAGIVTLSLKSFLYTTWYGQSMIMLVLAVILLIFGYLFLIGQPFAINPTISPATTQKKSIAILPFQNLNDDLDIQYSSYAINAGVVEYLLKNKQLRIVPQSSVEQLKESLATIPKKSDQHDVNYVVSGSVQRVGNRIMIIVHINDGNFEEILWSKNFFYDISDMIAIQNIISKQIAEELQSVLATDTGVDRKVPAK
jgi:TolB-like protein/AraC-like DNA-binding protein